MSIELIQKPHRTHDPIDALASAAERLEYEKERIEEGELHIMLPSVWRDIGLWFTWRSELSTLQMGAPIDLKAPASRLEQASHLVTMVNERLWVGHFDLWADDHSIVLRHSVILPETGALSASQADGLIRAAGEAVDRFYPAFNFLVWGGKKPEAALKASLFETAGSA